MPLRPYFDYAGITLYHDDDCREILPQLPAETFDLVVTGPPYLVSYAVRWGSDHAVIQGDSESGWVAPVYRDLYECKKPDAAISDVIEWHQTSPLLHQNQKPLGAISKLVCTYSRQDALILDPFCGSGTTLVVARRSNRRAVGIESEECFCELAALRLSQGRFDFANIPSPQPLPLTADEK